jgi:hypothetical protein
LWKKRCGYGFWVGESEGEEKYENLGVSGRMIRKGILKNLKAREWRGLIWLKVEASGGIS